MDKDYANELHEEVLRELRGVQEMLGQVLHEVGKPVVISKEKLKAGVPEGTYVDIQDTGDAFVFSVKVDS
jgi:hypothetical protein